MNVILTDFYKSNVRMIYYDSWPKFELELKLQGLFLDNVNHTTYITRQ